MASALLAAAKRQSTDHTPIWLMRQAGRCLPAYRQLRERFTFTQLTDDADLVAQVTLMPFEVADLDAAIIFADMMTPVPALGIDYRIVEGVGPVVDEPLRTRGQIDSLSGLPIEEVAHPIFEGIRLVTKALPQDVAMLGFAGAPFTLASYLVEGRPDRKFPNTRSMMADPEMWEPLMDALCDLIIGYLKEQIAAGAQAIQLFDSWAGSLSAAEYTAHVLPHTRRVLDALAPAGVPRIHFATSSKHLLGSIATLDCEVISLYDDISLDEGWTLIGDKAVQGNMDPELLTGSRSQLESGAKDVLAKAAGRPGHIFNLGHGVLPSTPADNLKILVDLVHEEGKR